MRTRVRIRKHIGHIPREMRDRSHELLKRLTLFAESRAKKHSPVKTGHLRRSIHHQFIGKEQSRVGTAVKYAPPVELGRGPVRPKKAKALKIRLGGRKFIFRASAGPAKGHFFFRKTKEETEKEIKPIAREIFRR